LGQLNGVVCGVGIPRYHQVSDDDIAIRSKEEESQAQNTNRQVLDEGCRKEWEPACI
jgi:hypothetical protein